MALLLGSCTGQVVPPAAAPVARAPAAPPTPPSVSLDWQDWPYTPGTWRYADGVATFGEAGRPIATLRCDMAARGVVLIRTGTAPGASAMTLRTSYGTLRWPARDEGGAVAAQRPANDPGLDWIAFSRGRFTVEVAGLPTLVLPTWAEPVRVIEDCRG